MPEVYAQIFHLTPRGDASGGEAIAEALREWVAYRNPEARGFDFSGPKTERMDDGSILRWEPFESDGIELFDFTWRHPHVGCPSITWCTRVTYFESGESTTLSIRVANTGPDLQDRNVLLTTRPRVLLDLARHFEIRSHEGICLAHPSMVDADEVSIFVRYTLFDHSRAAPVILLTPNDAGEYEVSPNNFGAEFMSLGRLYCLSKPEATYVLTDEIGGKHLSCFHGALRVYMPGLRKTSDPFKHPLLLSRHVAQKEERYRLAQQLALLTTKRFTERPELAEARDERAVAYEERRALLIRELQGRRETAEDLEGVNEVLELAMTANKELLDKNDDLKVELQDARAKIRWLEWEVSRLRGGEAGEPELPDLQDEPPFEPATVREAVEIAAEYHGDVLCFLPRAQRAAAESNFCRPGDVLRALTRFASVLREFGKRGSGSSLLNALKAEGVDYRSGISKPTPKKLRQQYTFFENGILYKCEEHICLGSGYDPASCLRIYLTTKQRSEGRAVVGHVGRHLDVITTT